jgi:riboflavin biosynthesis pyrimidine reductase
VRGGHADKLVVFVAPNIMGGERSQSSFTDVGTASVKGVEFEVEDVARVSRDVVMTLYPKKAG